jgi:hypothetical protein
VYVPADVVEVVTTWPAAFSVIVTLAPLTIAPVGSVIVPWMLPVEIVV